MRIAIVLAALFLHQLSWSQQLLLTHVNIVNPVGDSLQKDMMILVRGNKISAIGKTIHAGKQVKVFDLKGKYIIPGLWDMHIHTRGREDLMFPLLVANGVTSVREMANSKKWKYIGAWRDSINNNIASGKLIAPRMQAVAGHIIDGPGDKRLYYEFLIVNNEAEGREAVRKLVNAGADFIKVYSNIGLDAWRGVADEARKHNLYLSGHTSRHIPLDTLIASGQRTIEHEEEFYLFFASNEESIRHKFHEAAESSDNFYDRAAYNECIDSFSLDKVKIVAEKLKQNNIVVCPMRWIGKTIDSAGLSHPYYLERWKKIPVHIRTAWLPDGDLYELPGDSLKYIRVNQQGELAMREFVKAGVELIAGTDAALGNAYTVPGYSLQYELELYQQLGMSPHEVLKTATINAARFLKKNKELGSIEKGKLADLLILDANPLETISNTQRIYAVVLNGVWLNKAALDAMAKKVNKTLEVENRK